MKITKSQLKQIIMEELGTPSIYAYVEIPGEGGMIIEGDSVEEVKREGGHYGKITAIFTAEILEGEL